MWIGGFYDENTGSWRWVNGLKLDWYHQNYSQNEDRCLRVDANSIWIDEACAASAKYSYLCEFDAVKNCSMHRVNLP